MNENLYFQQLYEKESSTYTYLLADKNSKEAILIDPVDKSFERDKKLLEELDFNLNYVFETHVHADHITSASKLREHYGAKVILGKNSGATRADFLLSEGEERSFGEFKVKVLETPGHTSGCLSYEIEGMLFTGDTLLIRSVGRVDFQEGNSKQLFESIQKIYAFPNETKIFPAHNYDGITQTSVFEEKNFNTFIRENSSLEEFVEAMKKRVLPLPKRIEESVPANLLCGEKNE